MLYFIIILLTGYIVYLKVQAKKKKIAFNDLKTKNSESESKNQHQDFWKRKYEELLSNMN